MRKCTLQNHQRSHVLCVYCAAHSTWRSYRYSGLMARSSIIQVVQVTTAPCRQFTVRPKLSRRSVLRVPNERVPVMLSIQGDLPLPIPRGTPSGVSAWGEVVHALEVNDRPAANQSQQGPLGPLGIVQPAPLSFFLSLCSITYPRMERIARKHDDARPDNTNL